MENVVILCGGTGAHAGVAFVRLHTLGYALGFFDQVGRPFDMPALYLVDQDSGDGPDREPTAWQLARRLVNHHPARHDWRMITGGEEPPELEAVTPLPVGPSHAWFTRPHNTLENRFESSPYLPLLTSRSQSRIDYSRGMMGSPAVGSLLFKLKQYDERQKGLNMDDGYSRLRDQQGRVVVVGSGVGGTGASVGPTLAQLMAQQQSASEVMAVVVLNWFEFEEEGVDDEVREKAQWRNRVMKENAHSALEYFGQRLARTVSAVPVGMPDKALLRRSFTGDTGQPIKESFIHAVAALCAYRHLLGEKAYRPGLYIMGAVKKGRLDGATAIPGGTLQGLANQAATLDHMLESWRRVLAADHPGRVTPALYDAVVGTDRDPQQVAEHLGREIAHYREQLVWMREVLRVDDRANRSLTREVASRRRLRDVKLAVPEDASSEEVAAALFHWSAGWIKDLRPQHKEMGLEISAAAPDGGHWPDLQDQEGLGIAAEVNGDLTRIDDANRDAVLQAFVNPKYVSANGWPHPVAAAAFFREAVRRRDELAVRQLELMLVGVVSGTLKLRPVTLAPSETESISLEKLIADYRRNGYPALAEMALVYPERGDQVVGSTSPFTLLCPVPYLDDAEGNQLWDELWRKLTGASDGAPWKEAREPETWGEHDLAVRQVRAWVEHLRRSRPGNSPPWTRAFERFSGRDTGVPFGAGLSLKVFWGTEDDADRPMVDVNVPTSEPGVWTPPPDLPVLSEEDLLARVPELLEISDDQGMLFAAVELEMVGRDEPQRGFWDEHLDLLRKLGKIHIWSRDEDGGVVIGMMEPTGLHVVRLARSLVLDRKTIRVSTVTPLKQEPVPGSRRISGEILYPHLPLKAEYLDLVETKDGERLLPKLKRGDSVDLNQWLPTNSRDPQGRTEVSWNLRLRGRRQRLPVPIRLGPDAKAHGAHLMVWPRFRSRSGTGWRTYYIYDHCTDPRLGADVLWLEGGADKGHLARCRNPKEDSRAFPVAYNSTAEVPSHSGGPPLALALRNTDQDEEQGLYLVPLEVLTESNIDTALSIDFGTSHSVAAAAFTGERAEILDLSPELIAGSSNRRLTLHVSEDWSHVAAPSGIRGLLSLSDWLPTYTTGDWLLPAKAKAPGFLPSELILSRPLDKAKADNLAHWVPGCDYLIPRMDVGREDLAKFLLTDFKWDAGSSYFRGREPELREHYMSQFLELVMAELVANRIRGFPTRPVNTTFTYPLRSRESQVQALERSVERVLARGVAGMGVDLILCDGGGLFDESRAARLTTRESGEVCLVADLGGGTLDLFISAESGPQGELPQVADSARLGGNLLLRLIAESPDGLLPADGNWNGADARDTETRLRTWMRSMGAPRLFGVDAGDRPFLEKMELYGFQHAAQASRARLLIDRYFRLITEYMARSLVSYLVEHWFPDVPEGDHERLRITVQLRGNGWRLRYQDENYTEATTAVQNLVRARLQALWEEIEANEYPLPAGDHHWLDPKDYEDYDPKGEPAKNVVGKAMPYEAVKRDWHSHLLVALEIQRKTGERQIAPWHAKLPIQTGGSKYVELTQVSPPLPLSSPFDDERVEIANLAAAQRKDINDALKDEGIVDGPAGTYRAPVAALVWEAVFRSNDFRPK